MSDRDFGGIRACVFDAYGTLFDFASAAAGCADVLGERAAQLTALWRDKQLQYTWLRAAAGRHDRASVNHRLATRRKPTMNFSAPAVNQVISVPDLTTDPFLKQLDNVRKICQRRLAVIAPQSRPPLCVDVAGFGAQADARACYPSEGRLVVYAGRGAYPGWTTAAPAAPANIVGRVGFGGRERSAWRRYLDR